MDARSGKIYELSSEEYKEALNEMTGPRRDLIQLSDKEATFLRTMGAKKRKNYMRNKPCVCGSGKKFKKCCWSNYV